MKSVKAVIKEVGDDPKTLFMVASELSLMAETLRKYARKGDKHRRRARTWEELLTAARN